MAKEKVRIASKDASRKKDVLLESMEKHFRLVLEGHAALDKELKDFRGDFREFQSETRFNFKTLTSVLDDTRGKLHAFEAKTDANFKAIREYLSRIDDEIQDLKRRLTGKAEVERLQRLEERVAHIELVVKKYYGKNSN